MSDSLRPYPGMSVLPISRLPRLLLSAAALVAVPIGASASVHHAVAPVHHEVANSIAPRGRRTAEPVAHAKPRGPARPANHGEAEEPAPRRGKTRGAHEEARSGHKRRGDDESTDAPRGHRNAKTKTTLTREDDEPVPRNGRRRASRAEQAEASTTRTRRGNDRHISAARASDTVAENDSPADRGTRDRVHAWYRTHTVASNTVPVSRRHAGTLDIRSSPTSRQASVDTSAVDLSTAPHKATAADFERAAAAQRLTIKSAAEQNSRQTTAADDAADAQTHIPSTAPTEREPAPFTHGDPADAPAPANNTSRRAGAPIVRQRPNAATEDATSRIAQASQRPVLGGAPVATVDLSVPAAITSQAAPAVAHVNLHATGTAPPAARRNAPSTDAAVLAANPIAIAADSSSRAIRAVAAETAASATPRMQLPAPPAPGRRPAIAAIQAGDAHPVLDPTVSAGMADETFDGDNVPATAGTAIRLSTGTPRGHAAPDPEASSAAIPVTLYDGGGHLLLLPPMKGTHEILVHQNQMAMSDGLERVQNDGQLANMRRTGLLVALPDDDSIYPNDALPLNRRYARPWTVRFLRDIARAHYTRFGTPLIVTSAVRTVEFQRRLVRVNGNAAPPTGDIASPHLYGQAIDFAKHGMSLTEITWMRAYLTPVENDGKIDVEEEFQQACFHISVYRRYLGVPAQKKPAAPPPVLQQAVVAPVPAPAPKHRLPTSLLATHLP